ncbi:MAG: translation initiation factor IF-3 [Dehalococcoidia bacterium]|nr:translation initiation factor IF-3 [Dehalococcoidia bacterium]
MRLIGETGEQLGTMPLFKARELAKERGFDIVEVSPQGNPPVCRLLDYGKFKYEQTKKERDGKKRQKSVYLREVRMRPKIGEHDIQFKTRIAKKLIEEGSKVKITILFRGREITHPELGKALLERVASALQEEAIVERTPVLDGKRMIMVLAPAKQQLVKPARKPAEESLDAEVKNA